MTGAESVLHSFVDDDDDDEGPELWSGRFRLWRARPEEIGADRVDGSG